MTEKRRTDGQMKLASQLRERSLTTHVVQRIPTTNHNIVPLQQRLNATLSFEFCCYGDDGCVPFCKLKDQGKIYLKYLQIVYFTLYTQDLQVNKLFV